MPQLEDTIIRESFTIPIESDYEQIDLRYDEKYGALWYTLKPASRPCFNLELLHELRCLQRELVAANAAAMERGEQLPVRYTVLASDFPGVFNLGGDLALFAELIQRRDRKLLLDYATACIDVLYPNAVGFDQHVTTLSLVQGDALAGGFEAAISSHVVIAEKSARFGLPEVLFNLIPGMGAYTFLIRQVSPEIAERLILSGDIISADQMHELGLVDIVVDDASGHDAVRTYFAEHHKRCNAYATLRRVRQLVNPVTYEELIAITSIWVDAAMQLTDRDLRMISRIVGAQNRIIQRNSGAQALEASG